MTDPTPTQPVHGENATITERYDILITDTRNFRMLAVVYPGATEITRKDATDSEWYLCQQLYATQGKVAAVEAERDREKSRADEWCKEVIALANESPLNADDPHAEANPKVWREIKWAFRQYFKVFAERDALRAENGRLTEALRRIVAWPKGRAIVPTAVDIAEAALALTHPAERKAT